MTLPGSDHHYRTMENPTGKDWLSALHGQPEIVTGLHPSRRFILVYGREFIKKRQVSYTSLDKRKARQSGYARSVSPKREFVPYASVVQIHLPASEC